MISSLDLLRSFLIVAEERHFTRAATRLHIAQPALSKRIRQLEDELGLELFVRDRRGAVLTAEGAALIPHAAQVLEAERQLSARARALCSGESGALRIGFAPSAPHHVLPVLMRAFRRSHPGVACTLTELGSEAQLEALLDRQLDVGIVRPPAAPPRALHVQRFFEEPFLVALPRDHRFAARKSLLLEELATERFVLVARGVASAVYDQVLRACRAAGFEPGEIQEGSQLHAVIGLVAAGCGVSVLPSSARQLALRDVVYRPLRRSELRTIMAVACLARGAPVAARQFMSSIARALPRSVSRT